MELDGLEGFDRASGVLYGNISSRYWILTSCNLPESEFAIPLSSRGTLVGGEEMRSKAESLSPVGAVASTSERRSRAERLVGGDCSCPPEPRRSLSGLLAGEEIASRCGFGDGVCET